MANLMNLELDNMTAEELRVVAREIKMPGAWKAKKKELIDFIQSHINTLIDEQKAPEVPQNESKPKTKRGRTRTIEVYKDGEFVISIEGLLNTFKWVSDNKITNQGWVKRSLKNNEETVAGWKYKNGGGYLFKYAE